MKKEKLIEWLDWWFIHSHETFGHVGQGYKVENCKGEGNDCDLAYQQIRKIIEIWYKYNLWNLHTVTSTIGEQEGINEEKEKP